MNEDDLPPGPPREEESAAGIFGQLFGASMWLALFLAAAGIVAYFLIRAHG